MLQHCRRLIAPALTLKAPITTAADDSRKYFFHCFSEKIRLDFHVNPLLGQRIKIRLDFSCESSARAEIKPYFLRQIKVKKIKYRLLQFLFCALRFNHSLIFYLIIHLEQSALGS